MNSFTLSVPHLILQRQGKGHHIWHGLCIGHILSQVTLAAGTRNLVLGFYSYRFAFPSTP